METSFYGPYRSTNTASRWLATGFVAGAIAVLVFHQGTLAMLHAMGVTDRAAFPMKATAPFGIPQVLSLAFWGGAWGLAMAALMRRLDGPPLVFGSLLFGAIVPSLIAWFVVAPLKGQPGFVDLPLASILTALAINGAWGLGTGAFLLLFGRSHVPE